MFSLIIAHFSSKMAAYSCFWWVPDPFYQNLCDLQYSLRTLQWFLQCTGYIISNVNKRKPKGPSPFHTNILSPFIHICIQKRPGIPSTWSFRFLLTTPALRALLPATPGGTFVNGPGKTNVCFAAACFSLGLITSTSEIKVP